MRKLISILLIVSIFGLLPMLAVANTETPISVDIEMQKLPKLNDVADVSITVKSTLDAPNTDVRLVLPAGVSLVNGKSTWKINLKENVPTTLSTKIKIVKNGNFEIEAVAKKVISKDESWGDIDVAYLNVNDDITTSQFDISKAGKLVMGDVPTDIKIVSDETTTYDEVSLDDLLAVGTQKGDVKSDDTTQGMVRLDGIFNYWIIPGDYRSDASRYVRTPGRYFLVEILNKFGATLKTGYTDNAGRFSLTFMNPGASGMRLRVYAYDRTGTGVILATTPDGTRVYYAQTTLFSVRDGLTNLGTLTLIKGDPTEGAFWIKGDMEKAYRSIYTRGNPGSGIARWSPSSTDGTYYRIGEHIHLAGVDKRSPDTVVHEYGHNVMYNVYGNWFPYNDCPSPHYIQRIGGSNCGWTEGFANFFSMFVNGNPVYTWPSGATLNLETPTVGTPTWDNGDRVEGRVAGALWDIYDPTNEGRERITDGIGNIWYTFYHQKDDGHANDNTFAQYWSKLRLRYASDVRAKEALKQNTIDY